MSALSCNIVNYRPDPAFLAANFRIWNVEALLGQAADLIDRCLEEHRYYSHLDYAWNDFRINAESEEKQVEFEVRGAAEGVPADTAASGNWEYHSSDSDSAREDEAGNRSASEPAEALSRLRGLDLRAEVVQRKKELSAPGRPFALDEQRDLSLKRLCRDYEEAVNRAFVAEEGLRRIYDRVDPSSPLPYEPEPLSTSITNLAIWIRNAMEWLAGYQQSEQAFTRMVSVRSLLSRNAWTQLKHTRDSFSTKVQVPADLFKGFDNCRLRGIGALLVGEAGTVPWSMTVRLPDEAVYERSGRSVEVDQSALPFCLLGRVENRRSIHGVEICGEVSLMNSSPVGRSTPGGLWSLEILRPAGATSESFGHLEDVLLEIKAVGAIPKAGG